jgi:hypothetical protein
VSGLLLCGLCFMIRLISMRLCVSVQFHFNSVEHFVAINLEFLKSAGFMFECFGN